MIHILSKGYREVERNWGVADDKQIHNQLELKVHPYLLLKGYITCFCKIKDCLKRRLLEKCKFIT